MRVSDILDLLSMYDRAILTIAGRKIWEGRAYTMSEKFGKYFGKAIHTHSSDTLEIVLF